MIDLKELFIGEDATILEALEQLDKTGQRILFVTRDSHLLASLTDGDVRKYILRGSPLDGKVSQAANYQCKSLPHTQRSKAKKKLAEYGITALPLVDGDGNIVDVIFDGTGEVKAPKRAPIPVVIMAGGLGTRLYPYTKILPKPLIPVGEKPILEHIIDRFREFGCDDFRLVVNYKKNMIKSYFSDLDTPYHLEFLEESQFLGTGGGLCLLKGSLKGPFFFSNCDTLLDIDYGDVYQYHLREKNLITMICAFKHYVVPYGVVELDEKGGIAQMKEKPSLNFLTNTGVYLVDSRVVEELEDGKNQGFPDIIEKYRQQGEKIGVYPISEGSWMDMGQLEELENMRRRMEEP